MLENVVTEEKFRFYIESSSRFRFPFFDPENPYRKNGLFVQLDDALKDCGEHFRRDYGSRFVSVNMRGSWLRGIPLRDDDIDVLFIVSGLPVEEQNRISESARSRLKAANDLFNMCRGKEEEGLHVDPILFLDLSAVGTIMNTFMYGLGRLLDSTRGTARDAFQDSMFGSHLIKKILNFLKSGILIPYVGWIFGEDRKPEVFDTIARHLPIPTRPTPLYDVEEIDTGKELIRQTFIARNLIFPSIKLREFVDLKDPDIPRFKEEALRLYRPLELMEKVHARAVVNYLYTAKIEQKFIGRSQIRERVAKFTADYDAMVAYILAGSGTKT